MKDTLQIQYKDYDGNVEETVLIRRLPRSKYKELISLQQLLTNAFIEANGSTGSVISDDANWKIVQKIAAMLPVVGQEKPGIDIKRLEDDLTTISRLFFTQAINEDGTVDITEGFKPSMLAEFHHLDYATQLGNAVELRDQVRLKREMSRAPTQISSELTLPATEM